jgi:glycosyltransferase involved in cell wall biosynthesis
MEAVAESRALVFPSRWAEPFGLGVIEAMAAGKPVIATYLGGPGEIIDHGVNGLLVPPESPTELCSAILSTFRQPDFSFHMGLAAREKYELAYTPEAHAAHLGDLFQRLVQCEAC